MWFDPLMSFILRSPLHPLLGDTMLLTVTGRKTGRKFTTPVGFYREGNTLWILSYRHRTWWRNLKGGAEVDMRIRGKDVKGFGETVLDEGEVTTRLIEYVCRIPMAARSLGIRMENGEPHPEDAARLAKERLFVKVRIL